MLHESQKVAATLPTVKAANGSHLESLTPIWITCASATSAQVWSYEPLKIYRNLEAPSSPARLPHLSRKLTCGAHSVSELRTAQQIPATQELDSTGWSNHWEVVLLVPHQNGHHQPAKQVLVSAPERPADRASPWARIWVWWHYMHLHLHMCL